MNWGEILKSTSLIIGIIGGAVGLVSIFYGFTQKQRMKRMKAREERREEYTRDLIERVVEELVQYYVSHDLHKNSMKEIINKWNAEANAINNKLDRVMRRQDTTEALRIKNDIVAAADDIRAGLMISETRYLALAESHKYYKEVLKKNSFIEAEFNLISKKFYENKNKKGG